MRGEGDDQVVLIRTHHDRNSADALDPFHVGAEARSAGEIEGQMDAETAAFRHRIDEPLEGGAARKHEIVSLRQIEGRHLRGIESGHGTREALRAKPGGIHQISAAEAHRCGAADVEQKAVLLDAAAPDRAVEGKRRAMGFCLAQIAQHQAVAVDDPGRGGKQGGRRIEGRLQRTGGGGVEPD